MRTCSFYRYLIDNNQDKNDFKLHAVLYHFTLISSEMSSIAMFSQKMLFRQFMSHLISQSFESHLCDAWPLLGGRICFPLWWIRMLKSIFKINLCSFVMVVMRRGEGDNLDIFVLGVAVRSTWFVYFTTGCF